MNHIYAFCTLILGLAIGGLGILVNIALNDHARQEAQYNRSVDRADWIEIGRVKERGSMVHPIANCDLLWAVKQKKATADWRANQKKKRKNKAVLQSLG